MSESPPKNSSYEAGLALQKQDEAHPVRGPIVTMVRKVLRAAYKELQGPLLEEFEALQASFPKQFADPKEAKRYRLYQYIIGGTPDGDSDLFDVDGSGSILLGILKLAEKYHIDIGKV